MEKLKYIKGAIKSGCPADIYFYTDVDYWSVDDFIKEFNWLVNHDVSKINVHINSCGGCCVDGMSVFSRILDCPIPTACYNDGLAASMGSVIWAAGQEVYMKDYALLMIHNPFVDSESGKTYNNVTEAFTSQLKTIYQKRFGLSEDEIKSIMDGEGTNDGTFFTAAQAVERGFLSKEHIIETTASTKAKVNEVIKDGVANMDISKIKAVMNELTQQPKKIKATKENENINKKVNKMNENEITVFAALLGMTGEKATVEGVSAQINSIKAKAEKYDTLKAAYDKVNKEYATTQTELEGAKASVKNLTADLETANASLKQYKDAEAAAMTEKINALVDDAIAASKIDKDSKETWVKMAQNDFKLAESVLNSIPARADLSKEISHAQESEAQKGVKTEEERIKAEVDKVVGENFKFRTLD